MRLRKAEWSWLALALLSVVLAAAVYNSLPPQLTTHWNASGEPNGYMPRFWGIGLFPIMTLALALLFWAIPRIDPWRKNFPSFLGYYDTLVILLLVFLLAAQVFVILWNLGWRYSPQPLVSLGVGCLLFYTGVLCAHARPNWFVGIRTPWTLSSPAVWDRTHKAGARLFKAAGILALVGSSFPSKAIFFVLVPVLAVAVYTVAAKVTAAASHASANFFSRLFSVARDARGPAAQTARA